MSARHATSAAERRIHRELQTVRAMIGLYCRGTHHVEGLCGGCQALWDYASARVEGCPFRLDKPTCLDCPVHCFKPEMRERVRAVMRWAGPRMTLRHPVLAALHVLDGLRKRQRPARKGER